MQRNGIQLPGPFDAPRIAIHVIGDALLLDQPVAGFPAAADFLGAQAFQLAGQLRVMGARPAVLGQEFIKCPGRRW